MMNTSTIDTISAVLITKDAAQTIGQTLDSLSRFREVVIYDNGSTDDTLTIARTFSNVTIQQGEFLGFGPTKNHAISLGSNDWVFSLDADESPSSELLDSLANLDLSDADTVYEICRDNYFMGKQVRHGGWGSDWLVRVFNRQNHRFTDSKVHEKVATADHSRIVRLKGTLRHEAITDLKQILDKINRYSEIRKETRNKAHHPALIFLRAGWAFFRSYVLKLGFLEGWRGLVIAVSNANGVFYKYMKVYAKLKS